MINAFIMAPIYVFANISQEACSCAKEAPSDIVDEEPETKQSFFCCITEEAYKQGKAQQVENDLRSACISAPKLVKVIRLNEALGYLDTKYINSKELYDLLNEHFGLPFKPRNFAKYRSAF